MVFAVAVPIPKFPDKLPPDNGRYELKAVFRNVIVSYDDKSNEIVLVALVNGALNVNTLSFADNKVVKAVVVV